jgi:hypothetical protein
MQRKLQGSKIATKIYDFVLQRHQHTSLPSAYPESENRERFHLGATRVLDACAS